MLIFSFLVEENLVNETLDISILKFFKDMKKKKRICHDKYTSTLWHE